MKSDLQDMIDRFAGEEDSALPTDHDASAAEPSVAPTRRLRLPAVVHPH